MGLQEILAAGVNWGARGVGVGSGISMLTGRQVSNGADISGFVRSMAEALLVMKIFGQRAVIKVSPGNPARIQVRVAVEREHERVLRDLQQVMEDNDYDLTPDLLHNVLLRSVESTGSVMLKNLKSNFNDLSRENWLRDEIYHDGLYLTGYEEGFTRAAKLFGPLR